ncbi:tetratricopeptide repeat protein [Myxococcus sp. K15C18031901]|uniref:tetratricopeptide repeat protein n=1 Tax=Myxococcus dinghuensis TaxID=2906761 RepID=UPI0020A782DA|nr:tetratricopeptide repeat protein [Myxococcus dinghuensis]MCP3101513.1 tetratricopeptide repeat protein [Myxococcus dinghuensis]
MRCIDETVFMKLLLGELSPLETTEVDAHLDTCASCRTLVAEGLRAQLPPSPPAPLTGSTPTEPHAPSEGRRDDVALEKGTAVGRYLVLEMLGAGAMGVVYGAYDPELDRRVALKLLRTNALGLGVEKERAHLLREAQAMARVSHPNVIAVYDVGTFGQHVFLAMERVEAQTLGDWMKAAPRPWRTVLDRFLEAGQGLAAAHAAGVVHGDFKPENVLLDKDDQVHVTDFGLARLGATSEDASATATAAGQAQTRGLDRSVRGGTPAYMAPEQLLGTTRAGPAGDQYSFCVALHEALYGLRPFDGGTLAALTAQVAVGDVPPAPTGTRVPPWVRRVLLRGLARRPEDRFPSLEALLDALQKDPMARWRRALQLSIAVTVLIAAVGLTHAVHTSGARACAGAHEEVANIWGPSQQSVIHAAFMATRRPYASAAWEQVRRELDAYTAAWATTRVATCEATRVRGEQSEDVLAWRMRCLDNRLADVAALASVLAQADARMVDEAHRTARTLPSLASCSEELAPGVSPPPLDADGQRRHTELRDKLSRGRALLATGRYAEGVTLLEPVVNDTSKSGNRYDTAEGALLLGELREGAGDWRGAESALFEAVNAAEATRQDSVAARAWTLLVRVTAVGLDEYALAARWKDRATAAIERLGAGNELIRIQLLTHAGTVLRKQRHYEEAVAQQAQALVLAESTFGPDSLEAASVHEALGATHWSRNALPEARAHLERAITVTREALGAEHPEAARVRQALGPVLREMHEWKAAEQLAREVLAVFERTLGPEHPRVYDVLNDLATALMEGGRMDDAYPLFERALAIAAKTDGAQSVGAAILHSNLASLNFMKKQFGLALEQYQRSLAIREKLHGPKSPELVPLLRMIGRVHQREEEYPEALPYMQRAVDILMQESEDSTGHWTYALSDLGGLYLRLDRPRDALGVLERADAGWDKAEPVSANTTTLIRFNLARALWDANTDRTRAVRLALEARAMAAREASDTSGNLARIDAWLQERHVR